VLGSRWVADHGDARLALAARNAVAKIAAVLPDDLREQLDASSLLVAPGPRPVPDTIDLALVRQAIRSERKLALAYRNADGAVSDRLVWPFALGFFDRVRVVAAWCELRQGFRHFRTDRILALNPTETRYPRRRQALLKEWRELEGVRAAP
jgi:predicted DNA-binding transcriptional regulator YafY